jgi:hypothetical protein
VGNAHPTIYKIFAAFNQHANRRPAGVRNVEPAAAADYAVGASGFVYPSTSIIRGLLVMTVPDILQPLQYIAAHIE